MPNREEVKVGDVIEVPPGVDVVCTTRYRIRVDELAAYGPYGPRVKADGSPMQSRSVQAENGLVMRVVPWDLIPKCIRHPAQQENVTNRCYRCKTAVAPDECCSAHQKKLCHACYRLTHFVEVCVAGCRECADEGLPERLREPVTT